MALDPIDFFYRDGTVTLTNGSDIMQGTFTAWDPAVLPYDFVFINGGQNGVSAVKEVLAVNQIRLAEPWAGPNLTDVPYLIMRWIKHTDPRIYGVRVSDYLTRLKEIPDDIAQQVATQVDQAVAGKANADLSNATGPLGKVAAGFTGDLNDLPAQNGLWGIPPGQPNAPSATGYFKVRREQFSDTNYATDIAYEFTADSPADTRVWRRDKNAGTWGAWYRLRWSEAELDARYAPRPQPTWRQVANRTRIPNNFAGGNTQGMCRTGHFARDDIKSIRLGYPNWYMNPVTGLETPTGGTATIVASIEYPVGVYTRVTFGRLIAGSVPSGQTGFSDPIQVDIPNGAEFWVRTHWTNPAGIPYTDYLDIPRGEAFTYAASGVADLTLGGTITNTDPNGPVVFPPCAIIGQSAKPSFLLLGDSRVQGVGDPYSDASHTIGHAERSLGALTPTLNLAIRGEQAQLFIASHAQRLALAAYCSHIICNYGINDLNGGRTAAQVLADLQTIRGYFPGIPFAQTTLEPWTTSTDGWATVGSQTPMPWEAQRTILNNQIRSGAVTPKVIEVSGAVETGTDSGRWQPFLTADGVHATAAGTTLVRFLQAYKLDDLVAP